jgi:hypothetical protein
MRGAPLYDDGVLPILALGIAPGNYQEKNGKISRQKMSRVSRVQMLRQLPAITGIYP